MLVVKEKSIPTPMLLQKLWSCLQTARHDQLYATINFFEVELAKSEIEHKEPIIVAFFTLQHAK